MHWTKSTIRMFLMFSMLIVLTSPVLSYETELRALASKLIADLERANQKSATVLDFKDLEGLTTDGGRFLGQKLTSLLVSGTQKVRFVDRANRQALLDEIKVSQEGLVSPDTRRRFGHLVGVDTIIQGIAIPLGNNIDLTLSAVDVESGQIVASEEGQLPISAELAELFKIRHEATDNGSSPPGMGELQIDAKSLRLTVDDLVIAQSSWSTGIAQDGSINLGLENFSGVPLGIAIGQGEWSAGPCVNKRAVKITGITVINHDQFAQLKADPNSLNLLTISPSQKIHATLGLAGENCNGNAVQGLKFVSVTVTMAVRARDKIQVLSLSAEKVSIRLIPWAPM